jgi:hypothetical protein
MRSSLCGAARGVTGSGDLVESATEVRIFGEKVAVRASIHALGGSSADAGRSQSALRTRLGIEAECPEPGVTISLE